MLPEGSEVEDVVEDRDQRPLTVRDAADRLLAGLRTQPKGTRDASETPESDDATETDEDAERDSETDETSQEDSVNDEATEAESTDEDAEQQPDEITDEEFDRIVRARKHRVRSNGQDLDVDYDELLAGHSRTDDYTRKTQAAAEARKKAEAAQAEAGQRRSLYDERLKQAEDALKAMMPEEPDWDQVRRDHPTEYPVLHTDWMRYQEKLAAVQRERAKLADEHQAEQVAATRQTVQDEFEKLLGAVPEWKDEGKRRAEFPKIIEVGKSYGLTDDDLASMVDHRAWRILRDAARYQDLVKQRTAAKAKVDKTGVRAVKTGKPGSALTRQPNLSAAAKAASRLAKSGDPADAGEAFLHILQAEKRAAKRR
jgi:hypothetical protein